MNDINLERCTLEGKWEEVVEMYKNSPETHTATITNSVGKKEFNLGTALHVAIELNEEKIVEKLLQIINEEKQQQQQQKKKHPLEMMVNDYGDTPLHVAASRGFARLCKLIIGHKMERGQLVKVKNNEGETPLFLAALNGRMHAFAYLSQINSGSVTKGDLVRKNGDSILHCAIKREFLDLAVIIMHQYDFLGTLKNNEGSTPLKVLATRPSAFRSSTRPSLWMRILYNCIPVKPLYAAHMIKKYEEIEQATPPISKGMKFPMNYDTFKFILALFVLDEEKVPGLDEEEVPSQKTGEEQTSITTGKKAPSPKIEDVEELRKTKKQHQWSSQLLKALLEKRPYEAFTGRGTDSPHQDTFALPSIDDLIAGSGGESQNMTLTMVEKKDDAASGLGDLNETPFLVAAGNGIVEMVNVILEKLPSAIHNTNVKKENVLLVAVKNRQPLVVNTLKNKLRMMGKTDVWDNLVLAVNDDENTPLHLAAYALEQEKHSQIAGSALQMMWDIKWYEYIKNMVVPGHFYYRSNRYKETATEIFKKTHKNLVDESSTWLKDTSQSCSVVAALVAGVSFATASSVPGGNDPNGKPSLEGQPAFDAFAISSLIGLCFSVTGLIMFLTILTFRKEANDFRKGLQIKLLLGLSSMFVSIVAMFVAFSAGHELIVNHQYRRFLFPFYAATSVPVAFYAVEQFPLYLDLLSFILRAVPQARNQGNNL